jgi:hypothetical protein
MLRHCQLFGGGGNAGGALFAKRAPPYPLPKTFGEKAERNNAALPYPFATRVSGHRRLNVTPPKIFQSFLERSERETFFSKKVSLSSHSHFSIINAQSIAAT